MHILFAVHGYKPAYKIGGPIESVSAIAERLVERGHSVSVFTTNSNLTEDLDVPLDEPISVDGVNVWYFKRNDFLKRILFFAPYFSRSIGYLYAPRMRKALDALVPEVDIIHTHLPFVYPTHAAGRAAIRHNKPLFYHQRGVFDPERLKFRSWKKKLFIRLFELPLLKKARCLIALTEAERESYRSLGVNTNCTVITNGIDVEKYWQNLPPKWEEKLTFAANAQVILFMGRLHPVKGADRLIEAFLAIKDRFPRAVLVCAGPDEFKIEDRLKKHSFDDLSGRVFFPGMVTGDYKKALLARANIFSLPSDAEGFSMAVLEAMASKTAVILSPGCHFNEVESYGAGKVVSKDVASIAAAMSELLADESLINKMSERAYELVKSRFSWDSIVEELIQVYQQGAIDVGGVFNGSTSDKGSFLCQK